MWGPWSLRVINSRKNSSLRYLENGDIRGLKTPAKLDKQYYINLAYDRLEQYGIGG